MPCALVRAYTQAMQRIDAQEQLTAVHTQQIGGGLMKPDQHHESVRDLQQRAGVAASRKTRPAADRDLTAAGIAVIQEPANE